MDLGKGTGPLEAGRSWWCRALSTAKGAVLGPGAWNPHIPPWSLFERTKEKVGRRQHAVTASSIPVLGVSQHEGVTPFVKRRRQPSEPAREKLRRQGTAHRHRRGSTEASGGATKKSEAARASAAAAPRQRSENPEVQRRAQRQTHTLSGSEPQRTKA